MSKEESYDSTQDTLKHISRVRELMTPFAVDLLMRADVHDCSKLEAPEKEAFDTVIPKLKDLSYGSPEYTASTEELRPALDHHYKVNTHHPQHYTRGIADMTLLDILEMLCDWKAARERHADGSMAKSLEINRTRFNIDNSLFEILVRTCYVNDWISSADVRNLMGTDEGGFECKHKGVVVQRGRFYE